VPDDVLVLPAHNEPFRGLHARLDALARRPAACAGPAAPQPGRAPAGHRRLRRAVRPPIGEADIGLLGMATGESMACLNHLLQPRRGTLAAVLAGLALLGRSRRRQPARC
jgi:hypothetical protein